MSDKKSFCIVCVRYPRKKTLLMRILNKPPKYGITTAHFCNEYPNIVARRGSTVVLIYGKSYYQATVAYFVQYSIIREDTLVLPVEQREKFDSLFPECSYNKFSSEFNKCVNR
jgi:hypothetical protein